MQGIHIQGGIANDRQQYSIRFQYLRFSLAALCQHESTLEGKENPWPHARNRF
jgi:hypothetical protein